MSSGCEVVELGLDDLRHRQPRLICNGMQANNVSICIMIVFDSDEVDKFSRTARDSIVSRCCRE